MKPVNYRLISTLLAALCAVTIQSSVAQSGIISVLGSPRQGSLGGEAASLTQSLISENLLEYCGLQGPGDAVVGMGGMVLPSSDPQPQPWENPLLQILAFQHDGLFGAAGISSPSVLTSGGSGGVAPAAIASWTFHEFSPPLTGRMIDRPFLILPTGPIFEILRPA